jgi:hypothetical protein
MADYYPLIAKAVAGLERNTGEGRRALYERARTALVAQLRGVIPALSESDITRERLALEEAIRKVEGEAARRVRPEPSRPDPASIPRPPEPVARVDNVQDRRAVGGNAPGRGGGRGEFRGPPPEPPAQVRTAPPPPRSRTSADQGSLTDQGLKGFRDVIAEANDLGAATAQAGKSARQAYAAVPSPNPELDRIEPRLEPEGFRDSFHDDDPSVHEAHIGESDAVPTPQGRYGGLEEYGRAVRSIRSYTGIIRIAIAIGILGTVSALGYWQRDSIGAVFQGLRGSSSQSNRDNTPSSSQKAVDRFRPGGQEQQSTRTASLSGAAVAQRVMLYEEDPGDPKGKSFIGTAVWRTETVSSGPGGAPELAVRADVEIPERKMKMTWSLRRNTDKALPASHTIEVMFTLPADFPSGGIADVRGILMKQAEQARGVPLSGLGVKVTSNFFLIGLSSTEDEMKRNVELLKDRGWFDVPIIYTNGRRAILALEKGTPGERAFSDAFAAWQPK